MSWARFHYDRDCREADNALAVQAPRYASETCAVCLGSVSIDGRGITWNHGSPRCSGGRQPSLLQRARVLAAAVRVRAIQRGLPDDWVLDLDKP